VTVTETPLDEFADNVWVKRVPLNFYGMQMGARMTVIRLSDAAGGGLFVHSPITLTPELKSQVEALGAVRFLIAPNRLHHLFISDWVTAYPDAERWCVKNLVKKRPDIDWTGVLDDAYPSNGASPATAWGADIDQIIFRTSFQNEALFLQRASKTLILVDLFESVWPEDHWLYRWVSRLLGTWQRLTLTYDQRLTVRDKPAARATCNTILSWDFDNIILAHGRLITGNGKQAFRDGMKWLKLEAPAR